MSIIPPTIPSGMSVKARRYTAVMGLYCLGMAWACLLRSELLLSPSFDGLRDASFFQGLAMWGWLHVAAGVTSLAAAWFGDNRAAVAGLLMIGSVTCGWAGGIYYAYATVEGVSPTAMIAYSLAPILNLMQARDPLTAPLEPSVERFIEEARTS